MGLALRNAKLYAAIGILAVAVISLDVIFGIILDSNWRPEVNVICDLGVSSDDAIAASFKVSCCVAGILFAVSSLMWIVFNKSKLMKTAGVFALLAGISLMGVGLLDKTDDKIHQLAVVCYAALFIVAIFFSCIRDIINRKFFFVACFAVLAFYAIVSTYDLFPYIFTQFLLMGFVMIWYVLKCLGVLRPESELLGRIGCTEA